MVVVSLVIFLFLLHVRSALVPIITLPLGVLLAFIPMYYQGLTANIMSLGGIAVAIGAMVDASIIIIENIHKKLQHWEEEGRPGKRSDAVVAAMQEVGPSIFFSLLVITVSFMPVFTLQATEGRLFKPLAFTKTYSMGFAAILAVTLTPALAVLLIRGRIQKEEQNPLNRWLIALYTPVVRAVVDHRKLVLVVACLLMVLTVPAYLRLQSEFMPPLNEGAILYMPTAPPGMSVTEAEKVLGEMDRELKTFPEVKSVFGKMGRARTPTDPAPLSMAETTVVLKPREAVAPGDDLGALDPRDRRQDPHPGDAERVLDADADAHRDAGDRRAEPARHPGVRRLPRGDRADGRRHREGGGERAGDAERLRRAIDGRLLHRLSPQARGRGPIRTDRRGHQRGDHVRDRGHEHHGDRRGSRALPDQRPLRARVPRHAGAPRRGPHHHPDGGAWSRSARSPRSAR